jgi:hypothetical protein
VKIGIRREGVPTDLVHTRGKVVEIASGMLGDDVDIIKFERVAGASGP